MYVLVPQYMNVTMMAQHACIYTCVHWHSMRTDYFTHSPTHMTYSCMYTLAYMSLYNIAVFSYSALECTNL